MEYWSVEKKHINPFIITPTLQYSNTPKLIKIEGYHDGLPSFGYRFVNKYLIRNLATEAGFYQPP
jgi:hypothetical protein